ncbi:sugar efflux transporter SetB [Paenibacillus sp. J31TS4]|uniref:MFS transporter n=1 Tax=Paenibacillus sp. J31TS4 TaxID=2807195 RepID=UPI001B12D306|nr:MFS transporter [Paenibacillus sp. J31TS4]GIP38348.1 sugar efflux transporter SetB [Paenibacillus sp. J31TS4]
MRIVNDLKAFASIKGSRVLIAAMFGYGIGTGILAPMNAVYLKDSIGLSKGEVTSIFAITLLLNMIVTISVGLVSDRIRRRKPIPVAASLLCLIGILVYMRADSYGSALGGMLLASVPSGMITGQLFAMGRNHFAKRAPEIVEIAQIWLRTTLSIGFFTGLLLGANLYLLATFQGVLWGNVAGYALLFVLLLVYREISAEAAPAAAKGGEPFSLLMLIALLILSCADAIRGLYLPLVVNETFGSPRLMPYIWSVQAIFELLFMTVAGYWAAKYGSKPVILLSSLLALITYLTYAFSSSLPAFFLVQPLYSGFVSVLYAVGMGYVQRMFLLRTGFGASLYVFISQTATLIGYGLPLLIEGLTPRIFYIPSALIVLSVCLMTVVLVKERRGRQHVPVAGLDG